jgi:hypothetical protein
MNRQGAKKILFRVFVELGVALEYISIGCAVKNQLITIIILGVLGVLGALAVPNSISWRPWRLGGSNMYFIVLPADESRQ